MEYVAQEKEGLQNAEEVSAAIQEAIKGIPYPSNEVVTIDHYFGHFSGNDAVEGEYNSSTESVTFGDEFTAKYYLPGIEFGKAKRFDISISISGEWINPFGEYKGKYYRGGLFLPEGGTYIRLYSSGGFGFLSGGDFLFQVYYQGDYGGDSTEASTSLYLARIA